MDALAYLATFASASETRKYAAASTGSPMHSSGSARIVTGTAERSASERTAAASPRSVKIAGWMPRGELAELVEGDPQLVLGLGQQLGGAVRSRPELLASELQREPEPEQALLRTVVEVSLETTPLLIARLDDPGTARAHLLEL